MNATAKAKLAQGGARKQKRKEPPPELLSLPDRLMQAMAAKGFEKQAELARAAGVGGDILTGILNRSRLSGIQAANVIRIADGLGVDAGWLLTGRGTMHGGEMIQIIQAGSADYRDLKAWLAKRSGKKIADNGSD